MPVAGTHYTKKFQEAYAKVLQIAELEGPARGMLAFRDAMSELGHEERVRNLYRVQDKLTKQAKFFVPNAPQEQYLKTKDTRDKIQNTVKTKYGVDNVYKSSAIIKNRVL